MPSVMGKIGRGFNRMSVCIFRALGIHKGHWSILFHSYSAFLVLIWFKTFSAPGIKLNTPDQAGTSTQNKRGKRKPLRYKVIVGSRAHHSLPWIEFATLAVGFFSVYNFFLMLKWSHVYRKSASTASSLCTNFQVSSFQRCKHAFQPLHARCWRHYCTFQGTVQWDKNVSFIFCVWFLCTYYLYEKYYEPVVVPVLYSWLC